MRKLFLFLHKLVPLVMLCLILSSGSRVINAATDNEVIAVQPRAQENVFSQSDKMQTQDRLFGCIPTRGLCAVKNIDNISEKNKAQRDVNVGATACCAGLICGAPASLSVMPFVPWYSALPTLL